MSGRWFRTTADAATLIGVHPTNARQHRKCDAGKNGRSTGKILQRLDEEPRRSNALHMACAASAKLRSLVSGDRLMPASDVSVNAQSVECVEIYIPKKLEHLSEVFNYLRRKLEGRGVPSPESVTIDGFSLYEVDGAFYGGRIYQERTLVVRILFTRGDLEDTLGIQRKILEIGRDIATAVALGEEELWVCHYPQSVVVFRPLKPALG
jgi:hypothetical protein